MVDVGHRERKDRERKQIGQFYLFSLKRNDMLSLKLCIHYLVIRG
jgi:hypothetical protein